ncbi:MAG TPA: dephospho-CoA kinase [Anaerolineae bacterium]|nr:dephospho-CoA kinase [Anaerolineae bacterium]
MAEKIVIGLTGNIATGKSLVLRMLQELGAAPIDADKLAHEAMAPNGPAYQGIVEEFGRFVLDSNGQINRDRLGRIAFAVPEAMAHLEAITHPAVRQQVLARINSAQAPVVVVEAIKLFESGLAEQCQATWVVTSPPDVQLKRLVERRKMSPEQAQQRIKAQSPQQEKVAKADMVIDNGGDLAKTWAFIKKQYTALLEAQSGAAQPAVAEPAPAPEAKPAAEIQVTDVSIRRAKRQDLEAMANLIATGTKGALNPDLSQMMELLFTRAYVVAMAGDYVVGVAGWQTENLIAGLQDFYVLRDDLWPNVGRQMLEMIHDEVNKLSCEVAMTFVLNQAGAKPIEFFESQGYEQAQGKDLGYMWKDAAKEWQPENSALLYKKLREQRIMVPM